MEPSICANRTRSAPTVDMVMPTLSSVAMMLLRFGGGGDSVCVPDMNFLEQTAVILAQAHKSRFAAFACPVSQSTFDQPRAVSIEIVDACNIDGNAARRDGPRYSVDLRLDRAGIFSRPRSGGAELHQLAARLAAEQNPRRH